MSRLLTWRRVGWLGLLVSGFLNGAPIEVNEAARLEFFEKEVRPVLIDSCYRCHSQESKRLRAGLSVDSRGGLLAGGDSGPAIVPGDPSGSLLIEAVLYDNPDLQMPPRGKLSSDQIAALTEWVRIGAPWPEERAPGNSDLTEEFDLEARRRAHWAWQPIRSVEPPRVRAEAWPGQPVDRFVLARLESDGLSPAPAADLRTLIRRLYFDLVGLPPEPAEVERILEAEKPGAYERLVEKLLASPHFGERWARHWLDLVRYTETLGHEFDYTRHNAWRYRDYVIRALNADVPYDVFLTEHVAGDLLPEPRRHPKEGFNESIIATASYWFGQQTHSPVDVRVHQVTTVDNQIDVLTKTFLGITVSCARCHDHKFDAVSTRDFYALYGMISSSRYAQRDVVLATRGSPSIPDVHDHQPVHPRPRRRSG